MAVIIGDIHGDLQMARAFLAYKPQSEHVSLGDLIDSRIPKPNFEVELACLELLLEADATLLWGNHDLGYLPKSPWKCFTNFPDRFDILSKIYQEAKGRFKAAYAVDGWLFTHAGVSTALTDNTPDGPWETRDTDCIAAWLNEEFERTFEKGGPLFARDWTRGGKESFGGIFWYDPQYELTRPDGRVRQIFGHTLEPGPLRKANWINIHIDSGLGYWLYDTEIDDFVMLHL